MWNAFRRTCLQDSEALFSVVNNTNQDFIRNRLKSLAAAHATIVAKGANVDGDCVYWPAGWLAGWLGFVLCRRWRGERGCLWRCSVWPYPGRRSCVCASWKRWRRWSEREQQPKRKRKNKGGCRRSTTGPLGALETCWICVLDSVFRLIAAVYCTGDMNPPCLLIWCRIYSIDALMLCLSESSSFCIL